MVLSFNFYYFIQLLVTYPDIFLFIAIYDRVAKSKDRC